MNFKPTSNRIIIKVKGIFNEIDDNGLMIDTSFNPHEHIRYDAEVVAIPERFSGGVVNQEYTGKPSAGLYLPTPTHSLYCHTPKYNYVADVDIDLEVGDKVYFKYLGIEFEQFGKDSRSYIRENSDGEQFHQIAPDLLICAVRNDVIIPLFGSTLISPLEDERVKEMVVNGQKTKVIVDENGLILNSLPNILKVQ